MLCLSGFELYSRWVPLLKDYKLFNQVLSSVQQHPDLGILLSDDLRGNSHVNKIVREANSTLGFVKRNLHFCSEETKRSASFRICLCCMGSLPARSSRQDLSGPETSSTIYQKRSRLEFQCIAIAAFAVLRTVEGEKENSSSSDILSSSQQYNLLTSSSLLPANAAFNPLSPKSDQCQTSPCNITAL